MEREPLIEREVLARAVSDACRNDLSRNSLGGDVTILTLLGEATPKG